MSWWARVEGSWRDTDLLTFDEIISIEQIAGEPWALCNPYRSGLVAKAMLAAFLVREGKSDEDAATIIGGLTLGEVKNSFRHREDDDLPIEWEDGLPVVDPKDQELTTGTS